MRKPNGRRGERQHPNGGEVGSSTTQKKEGKREGKKNSTTSQGGGREKHHHSRGGMTFERQGIHKHAEFFLTLREVTRGTWGLNHDPAWPAESVN